MRAARLSAAVIAITILGACSTTHPYRTSFNTTNTLCRSPTEPTRADCSHLTPEIASGYELHFVEFDDQGWLHPQDEASGEAHKQLDVVMKRLRDKRDERRELSIVVYVHGWKHTAREDDSNVESFRRILESVRAIEDLSGKSARDVIGIYVGWRGQSLELPEPLASVSFWDRKSTAQHVAQGSVRELFARLTGFQRFHNAPERDADCLPKPGLDKPSCNVKMLLIGHSFGAWILYSAISQSLVESLSAQADTGEENPKVSRFGDMVVLINAAFEGSRYESVNRAATRRYSRYQAPIIVSITSTGDQATRYAFPLGRAFSTVFQRPTSSPEQGEAISKTPGHIDRYITHEIELDSSPDPACAGWRPTKDLEGEALRRQLELNIKAENAKGAEFFSRFGGGMPVLRPGWTRRFCGGASLRHLNGEAAKADANSPVWNIRADPSIIKDHGSIVDPAFTSFIRQLYHDVSLFPQMR